MMQEPAREPRAAAPPARPVTPASRVIVQRRASESAAPVAAPESVHRTLSSPGRPLDAAARDFMESRFGHDFSQVRIHTDSRAGESARAINAHAYTAGPIIASRPAALTIARAKGDIATRPIAGKKPKPKDSNAGTHKVTPTGEGTKEVDDSGRTATLEEFQVEPFYLPAEKGPAAFAIYNAMAVAGSLESTLELAGSGRTKTALWQERPDTDELRDIWLQRVGWDGQTSKVVNDLWQRAGGDAEFPKVNAVTAQMDHIVELQINGNNAKENIQVLDPAPNQSSGGAIKGQLQTLAQEIARDSALSGGAAQQVKMRFTEVKQLGTPPPLPTTCPPPKGAARTALAVEACAMKLPVTRDAGGAATRVDYPINAAGRPTTKLKVPPTFATRADDTVPVRGDAANDPASTLIPGLLLTTLSHRAKQTARPDLIEAQIDTRDKTRLPLTLDPSAKPFSLSVGAGGELTLPTSLKKTSVGFTFKYLSAGTINSVVMNANGGIDWTGQIRPTPKFLPVLDVEYKDGALRLAAKIPEEKLKSQKIFGATVTRASLDLALSPFDATGNLDFILGSKEKPAGVGNLRISKDDQGLVGDAALALKIPKVDASEIKFQYKGGANREEWSGELKIDSAQIKVPYVTGGGILARVTSKAGEASMTFDGNVALTLPNNRGTAEVGLKRRGSYWVFAGLAHLNIPKVEGFSASVVYDLEHETLTASIPGKDGEGAGKPVVFTITEDFKGTLTRLNLKIPKGGAVVVTGAGGFNFKKGKAAGKVDVELAANGAFNGAGDVTYRLSDSLTVAGKVVFREKDIPRLRIDGNLTFAKLELMKAVADNRTLVDKELSIPIPYASIGGVGLKAIFGVRLEVGYGLGPVVIEPLVFSAGFNPLDDEPQLDLGASGELKVPVTATLSASLSGGVKVDAYIAEVGGKITITGTIKLKGGLFVPFKGSYSKKAFAVEMTPEARLSLLLGVALSATVWAKAGVGVLSTGVEKTWNLGQREVDTGLGFGIKSPISYNSLTGAKFPTLDKIEFIPPDFTKENLSRVADRLFGEAKGNPPEA